MLSFQYHGQLALSLCFIRPLSLIHTQHLTTLYDREVHRPDQEGKNVLMMSVEAFSSYKGRFFEGNSCVLAPHSSVGSSTVAWRSEREACYWKVASLNAVGGEMNEKIPLV